MIRNRLLTLFLTSSMLVLLPSCKEKKQPPPESTAKTSPAVREPDVKEPDAKKTPDAEPAAAPANAMKPSASTPPSPSKVSENPDRTPSPRVSAPRPSPTRPSVQMGSKDRDDDVSLVALAKSLTKAIDRAGRAFNAKAPDAALSEAIQARRSIPSPAKITAMGKAAGPNGVIVARQIESMRIKLDKALERLDRAGAGDAPSVMKNDIVIE